MLSFESCTLHGVSHLCKAQNKIETAFWALATLTAVFTGRQCYIVITVYFSILYH